MCFANPAKSLELARSRLTPEQWARFEREFNDFCTIQGYDREQWGWEPYSEMSSWVKWAVFCGRGIGIFNADRRVQDAHHERLAIAMMDDEQAVASLERWKEGK